MFEELNATSELSKDLSAWMKDPLTSLREESRRLKRPLAGLLCPSIPPEIPWAAGYLPFLLPAIRTPGGRADSALQSFCCIRVRSVTELLFSDVMGPDDLVCSIEGACDSLQNMSSILDGLSLGFKVSRLSLPICRQDANAFDYTRASLSRWSEELFGLLGKTTFGAESIETSMADWEGVRAVARELEELSAMGSIHRSSYLAAVRASLAAPPQKALAWMEEMKEQAQRRTIRSAEDPVRMGIVAGPLDHLGIMADLEEMGAHFVWDDSCAGSTLVFARNGTAGDPLDRLSKRLTSEFVCPVVFGSGPRRFRLFMEKLSERSGAAVVLLLWKFCDPYAFDSALFRRKLKDQKIPFLELEMDPVMTGRGQMLTRCQAFMESLCDLEA